MRVAIILESSSCVPRPQAGMHSLEEKANGAKDECYFFLCKFDAADSIFAEVSVLSRAFPVLVDDGKSIYFQMNFRCVVQS